jgi:O-acetyl-ADP-ribose deacetylase (regulator of RNase III)
MLVFVKGDIFESQAEALVNPVNTVGVMGKGLAAEFQQYWRHPSRLEWITEGLEDLRLVVARHQVRSIAVPALGAGNGGLDWELVRGEIERILGGDRVDADVSVYQPHVATLDKRRQSR